MVTWSMRLTCPSSVHLCSAVSIPLRTSTACTTRLASTASSLPPSTWLSAPCRCARCVSTSVRSTWWHNGLLLWPLTPEDQQRSSEDQSTTASCQLLPRGSDWFVGQTWIIYFWSSKTWMCLLLLYIMFHHSINIVFWLSEEILSGFIPSVASSLLLCDDGCSPVFGSAVYCGSVQSWWLWIRAEISLNLNM